MARSSGGRARIAFLNDSPEAERELIEGALDAKYNDDTMVGYLTVEVAREPEGWRVVNARMHPDVPAAPVDIRIHVIEALREASLPLTH